MLTHILVFLKSTCFPVHAGQRHIRRDWLTIIGYPLSVLGKSFAFSFDFQVKGNQADNKSKNKVCSFIK